LREVLDLISAGVFSRGDTGLFAPLVNQLLEHDPYMVLADYAAYLDCQARVDQDWLNHSHWTRMSILNTARIGKFSSDRAIQEYAADIWKISPQLKA
jgi:starch phosphorylase